VKIPASFLEGRHSLVCCHCCGHIHLTSVNSMNVSGSFDEIGKLCIECPKCNQFHGYVTPDDIVGVLDGFLLITNEKSV